MAPALAITAHYGVILFSGRDCDAPDELWDDKYGVSYVRNRLGIEVPSDTAVTVAFAPEGVTFLEQTSNRLSRLVTGYVKLEEGVLAVGADPEPFPLLGFPPSVRVDVWGHKQVPQRKKLLISVQEQGFTEDFEEHHRAMVKAAWLR